jgi:acyl-CoA hydrolase
LQIVTPAEAVASVTSGSHVFMQGASATPSALLEALVARAPGLRDVTVTHLHAEGPGPHLAPAMAGHLRHRAFFIGPNARLAVQEGRAEYIPVFLSDIPVLFDRGLQPVDVALINVSPPDAHGFCSLGTSVDCTLAAVRNARTVIAQLNPRVPRTHGDGFVHTRQIHLAVQVDRPLYAHANPKFDDCEQRIGQVVADLIPDEATLQLGIGAIPSAVCAALLHRRAIGIHTEMFTDAVVDLIEAGVVTGEKKSINRGKCVATFLMGTQRLYDFVHDNPLVEMRPADYTNDSAVIRRFRRMTAINSAIEVDLTGQVCADSIGTQLYSGVGGQMDFIRGAALAEDGRAIIALPSTAKQGTVTRIVPTLRPGAGVVTTRAHVHTVVTEHGVAELFGKSVPERARALIAIAAPEHREDLRAQARHLHYL